MGQALAPYISKSVRFSDPDVTWLVRTQRLPNIISNKSMILLVSSFFHKSYPRAAVSKLVIGVEGLTYWIWCKFDLLGSRGEQKLSREAKVEWGRYSKEIDGKNEKSSKTNFFRTVSFQYYFQATAITVGKQ